MSVQKPNLRLIAGANNSLHGGSEPPYNDPMEARVTRIETIIPTLATKEDLAKVGGEIRTEMHKEFHAMTWKLLGGASALVAAVYFIATHAK
ncbi:hypothetical protein [Polynucleobacter sp. JS-Safj-400b-B2]|uniref:hypothetical protein n=1 Tax=Polynucleobacter sp. JS-Safj-400b-B2 TaxID=2576921 RepID=UPI001C0E59B9|nr:hypothetical protein [Polynucleobacter sp. JS-Safj-400b-B2]